jgi:hypothetical protein
VICSLLWLLSASPFPMRHQSTAHPMLKSWLSLRKIWPLSMLKLLPRLS